MAERYPVGFEAGVSLHNEGLVPELPSIDKLTLWIQDILVQECRSLGSVSIAFMHDDELLEINKRYLTHDTFTDIITFPYSEDPVEAEICISTDRIRANSVEFNVSVLEELLRVIAHGILHICGWQDHPDELASLMRKREDACLVLYGIIPGDYRVSPS